MLNFENLKEFKIKDIFNVYRSSPVHKNAISNKAGSIPYISRTGRYNGHLQEKDIFVYSDIVSDKIVPGNTISIGGEGAFAFYHKNEYITGNNITILQSNDLNLYRGLYVKALLDKERYKYSYGRAYNISYIKETIIPLPEKNGKPDWESIDTFMKEAFSSIEKSEDFEVNKLEFDVWKEVSILDFFNVDRHFATISTIDEGDNSYPSVSMTIYQNGTENNDVHNGKLYKGGTITVTDWCNAFYQKDNYTMSGRDSMVISRKDGEPIPLKSGLIIRLLIEKNKFRFSFGRKCNATAIKKNPFSIVLPFTEDNKIDWQKLESTIKL